MMQIKFLKNKFCMDLSAMTGTRRSCNVWLDIGSAVQTVTVYCIAYINTIIHE